MVLLRPFSTISSSIISTGTNGEESRVRIVHFHEVDMHGVEEATQAEFTCLVGNFPHQSKELFTTTMISGGSNHLVESGQDLKVKAKVHQQGAAIG